MGDNYNYSKLDADDESSRDAEIHFRRQRYVVDPGSESTVPMHPPNLQQNPNQQFHAQHPQPDPNVQARRQRRGRIARLQRQMEQLTTNFNIMFDQFQARNDEQANFSNFDSNAANSSSSRTRSRDDLSDDDLRHALNQRRT